MCTYMSRQVPVHTCKIQTNNLKTFISCGKRKGKHILHVHVPGKFKIVKFTLYIHTYIDIHTYIHTCTCLYVNLTRDVVNYSTSMSDLKI